MVEPDKANFMNVKSEMENSIRSHKIALFVEESMLGLIEKKLAEFPEDEKK